MVTPLLRIQDKVTAPPGKWRYTCPRTGHRIESFSHSAWLDQIKAFYKANDFPLSDDWIAEAEHQLCLLLPPGHCLYDDGSAPKHYVNARIGINEAINGTKAIGSFILNGANKVPQELAESRAKTCASCFFSVPTQGCGSCYGLASLVTSLAGNLETKSDPQLQGRVCSVCSCLNALQVHIPITDLKKGVTQEHMEILESAPHCWKRQEILQLQQTVE